MKARDRRALVLGLVVVAPVALYRLAVAPWMSHADDARTALSAERALLARELAVVDGARTLPGALDSLRAELERARTSLLDGGTPLAVSGALSREIARVAREAGVLIQEVSGRDPAPSGTVLRTSSLDVRTIGDLEGVLRFLHALENASTLLTVGELSLRTAGINDGDLEQGQLMSLGLVVSGYWIPDVEPSGGPATYTSSREAS